MHKKTMALCIAALCAAGTASAQTSDLPSMWQFSGFGTLGAVRTDTNDAQYGQADQRTGATRKTTYGMDTKLGLQLTGKLLPDLSVTAQLLSRQNPQSSYRPELEWGFVKYNLDKGFSVRAGRMGLPLFMISDYRNVGYSNLTIRPPINVYGQVSISNFDGADILYQQSFKGVNYTAQLFSGNNATKSTENTKARLRRIVGLNGTAEYGPLLVRLGYGRANLTYPTPAAIVPLFDTLNLVGFNELVSQLAANGKMASFSGVGATLDWQDIVGAAEYTKRVASSFIPNTIGWYTTAGYRVGKFTPYATISRLRTTSATQSSVIPAVGPFVPLAGAVNAVLASSATAQKTESLGIRYDGFKSVALKLQFDRITPLNNTNGMFLKPTAAFPHRVNAVGASVDFVF